MEAIKLGWATWRARGAGLCANGPGLIRQSRCRGWGARRRSCLERSLLDV